MPTTQGKKARSKVENNDDPTRCQRCGQHLPVASYDVLDYCAHCRKSLCDECMRTGCCGKTPARSGTAQSNMEIDAEACSCPLVGA